MSGRGAGSRYAAVGRYLKQMLFSVEFLIVVLLQFPISMLRTRLGGNELTRFFPMLSILLVYFAGGIVRRKFGLRSLFRD